MKIIAIANQKGGVGKTTISTHLLHAIVAAGKRGLAVDFDKQGSFTYILAPEASADALQASELLQPGCDKAPLKLGEGVALIGADPLGLAAVSKNNTLDMLSLRAGLVRFKDDYDFCIIDTPGDLGQLTDLALAAADAVVCPVSVGMLEMKALSELLTHISNTTMRLNPKLHFLGLVPSKVNTTSKKELAHLANLRAAYPRSILSTTLAQRAAVSQAIEARKPVWHATQGGSSMKAAHEWRAACLEILKKAMAGK